MGDAHLVRAFVKQNSPLLLTLGASAGVVSTAYFAAKGGWDSAKELQYEKRMTTKEKARATWKFYIPAGVAGATTIVCIVGLRRVDGAKLVAAQTALGVSQRAFSSYREQVVEELGEKKDLMFSAKSAEARAHQNPPASTIVMGSGKITCCELFTMRYFECNKQTLDTAINEINSQILRHDYATLDDLYHLIDLEYTKESGHTGWKSPRLVELEYSSFLYKGDPVLAFDYNYIDTI